MILRFHDNHDSDLLNANVILKSPGVHRNVTPIEVLEDL